MTLEELQLTEKRNENYLAELDKEIDKLFLRLLKRPDIVVDRNKDWCKKIIHLQILYDEFNLEEFSEIMEKIKQEFIKRRELRFQQNKNDRELDLLNLSRGGNIVI